MPDELTVIPTGPDRSFWARVGGQDAFETLVRTFYAGEIGRAHV